MLSTPYHGYLKNLALAVSGRMDRHFTALHVGGHIKFFSIETLTTGSQYMWWAVARDEQIFVGTVPSADSAGEGACLLASPFAGWGQDMRVVAGHGP